MSKAFQKDEKTNADLGHLHNPTAYILNPSSDPSLQTLTQELKRM